MPTSQIFQSRFRELTDERGKNKKQIAADMNITDVLFSKTYNYGILPRPAVLVRIADYEVKAIKVDTAARLVSAAA